MKKLIITGAFLLLSGFIFSQSTKTDTTKTTTNQSSTKLVKRKVSVVPIKKVDALKQSSGKNNSQSSGKKEEENTQPK